MSSEGLGIGVQYEAVAVTVRANLGVAGIKLAAVDRVIVVRLVFVREEIDALAALLVAVRRVLKFQSGTNRGVLRGKGFRTESNERRDREGRHARLDHLST